MTERRGLLHQLVSGLFTLAPSPHTRWPVALQAGLSISLPLLVFTIAGRPDIGLLTAPGAFVAIYASSQTTRERARTLPVVAAVLLACAAAGALAAGTPLALPGLVLITIATAAFCYGYALGAPGPLFFVLVYGLAGHVVAPGDGATGVAPPILLGALLIGVTSTYLIATAALVLPAVRRRPARSLQQLLPGPRLRGDAGILVLRAAVVGIVGAVLGAWLVDPSRAYWAVCAGVGVIGVTVSRRGAAVRGVQRLIGTFVGVGVFALIAGVPVPALVLPLVLGVLQFVVEYIVVRNYALALVFITPLVLLITTTAVTGADPGQLMTVRALDTVIGAVAGALSALLHGRRRAAR